MASRTIQTTDEMDAALNFLGRRSKPPVSGEQYFLDSVQSVLNDKMMEADEKRFSLVKELMDDKDKGGSISKLKEVLGM